MRSAEFTVIVEDYEEGDDRISLQFLPKSGDQELMIEIIQMLAMAGKEPEVRFIDLDDDASAS